MQRIAVCIVAVFAFVLMVARPPLFVGKAAGKSELATKSTELARVPAPRIARGEAPRHSRTEGAFAAPATTSATTALAAASNSFEARCLPAGTWASPAKKTCAELMVFLN